VTTGPVDDRSLPRGVGSVSDEPIEVHFDGACETVRGHRIAAYGFTVSGPGVHHEDCGLAVPPGHERATNNVAEYVAAICALEWLSRAGHAGELTVIGDSELVVKQMAGEYQVRAEHLVPYHGRLEQLARGFRKVAFVWVPREQNVRADELSKQAIVAWARSSERAERSA
jgi:ribonuclease HI